MIDSNLKTLVIDEAQKLRQHATAEERANLNFGRLRVTSESNCIYGQMTGSCDSDRAIWLLDKCARPFSDSVFVTAKPVYDQFRVEGNIRERDFSPIECYICRPESQNYALISYLRGERENLTVNDL